MDFKEKILAWKEKNVNTEIIINEDLNGSQDFGIYLKLTYNNELIKNDFVNLSNYYICQFYISDMYNDNLFYQLSEYFDQEIDELELVDETINNFIKNFRGN